MGASKDLFMEIRIQAEMDEETYNQIPNEMRDKFKIKRIEATNFREHYEADKIWRQLHSEMVEKLKERQIREEEIRNELRFNNDTPKS